ncbi:hypothetical protein LINPERHAP1_LOCUS7516 [Linum perenne]
MAPQPKRRKIKQPPNKESSSGSKNPKDEAAIRNGFKNPATAEIGLSCGNNVRADSMIRIQQSNNFAVSEAQKDGCTGNYKIYPATAEIGLSCGNNVRADSMIRIQQSKNFAVSEAQKDGCTGNYKIFDSPFGNFLLPVVPTREDLLSG